VVNFDPDSGLGTPEVLKAVVRERDNKAGIYGTVIRCGRLAVGQPLYFTQAAGHREHR
jgi:MOSC domain-containing protein YiiM